MMLAIQIKSLCDIRKVAKHHKIILLRDLKMNCYTNKSKSNF